MKGTQETNYDIPKEVWNRFLYWYEEALDSEWVRNPVAWALYKVWKEYDEL